MEYRYFKNAAMMSASLAVAASLAFSGKSSAEGAHTHHKVVPIEDVTFQPGPGTLPEGVQVAALHGNPAEEGPFVIRLKFPAGYVIPPHIHPEEEHVTVISGKFGIGTGKEFDMWSVQQLAPGSFVQLPTGMPHFAWMEEETVVQINAIGPFGITYINEADDPRIN